MLLVDRPVTFRTCGTMIKYRRGPYYPYYPYDPCRRDKAENEAYGTLAQTLREARRNANLTQQELADKIGVGRSRLAQWETAKRNIPWSDWTGLRNALPRLADLNVRSVYNSHHENVTRLDPVKRP